MGAGDLNLGPHVHFTYWAPSPASPSFTFTKHVFLGWEDGLVDKGALLRRPLPDHQSLIPGTYVKVEGENLFHRVVSDVYTSTEARTSTIYIMHTHSH